MARPRGEIREAIAVAATTLLAERGLVVDGVAVDGLTWREISAAAKVGRDAARRTVDNMARAGDLRRIGARKKAGAKHWEAIYAPTSLVPSAPPPAWDGVLAEALRPTVETTDV